MVTDNFVGSSMEEFFTVTQPVNSLYKSLSNNLYGISNNNNSTSYTPYSVENYGMAFFTRPQLNLSKYNLRNERKLYNFLTTNGKSVHTYVRNLLDPRLQHSPTGVYCPLLDNKNAFIPVLTNNLVSMSGWPDIVLPTYTTDEGIRREQWAIGDGFIDIYNSFDLDCSFRNVQDEPILLLTKLWTTYISKVFEGVLSPYADFVINNEIDYNTRIYRLVLDQNKRYVKKIASTGASFPVNVPSGKFFDYNKSDTYNTDNKEVNIRFLCLGADYIDDILVKEFNETSGIFNKEMRNLLRETECKEGIRPGEDIRQYEHKMVKVPFELLNVFNYRSYPFINPITLELEWYVDKTTKYYQFILEKLKGNNSLTVPELNTDDNSNSNNKRGISSRRETDDSRTLTYAELEELENPFNYDNTTVDERERWLANKVDEDMDYIEEPYTIGHEEVSRQEYRDAMYNNRYKNMMVEYNNRFPNNQGPTITSDKYRLIPAEYNI